MAEGQNLFEEALAAARQKDLATARVLLKQLFKQEPYNVDAWLLGARVVETREDAIRCYQRVLQIDPNHAYAKQKLDELGANTGTLPTPTNPSNKVVPFQPIPIEPQGKQLSETELAQKAMDDNRAKTSRQVTIAVIGIVVSICCLVALGVLVVRSGGFSQVASQSTPTNQQLFNVLYANARAANKEDVTAYMATIHPSSASYLPTQVLMAPLFEQFDLSYQYYNLSVVSVNENEATIHFSLQTDKIRGPDFQNNIVTGTMVLKPDNGVWKIFSQDVEDVDYK